MKISFLTLSDTINVSETRKLLFYKCSSLGTAKVSELWPPVNDNPEENNLSGKQKSI